MTTDVYTRPYAIAPYRYPPYTSTLARSPDEPLITVPQDLTAITGPTFDARSIAAIVDLTTQVPGGEAQGQRIIVNGRVLDASGAAVQHALVELWQANAAGRYRHDVDDHDAPLDPYFIGAGRMLTDADGYYRFTTIEPGAYPWGNTPGAWRPRHLHFSVIGASCVTRLMTQMYFPGDPLLDLDPIFHSVSDPDMRASLVATFDPDTSIADFALAYKFDLVMRGPEASGP